MQNMELLERILKGRRALLKRQILECALTEFLRTGVAATTIEMIRDQADTSIGAIYHHFKNKEGIIAAHYILQHLRISRRSVYRLCRKFRVLNKAYRR